MSAKKTPATRKRSPPKTRLRSPAATSAWGLVSRFSPLISTLLCIGTFSGGWFVRDRVVVPPTLPAHVAVVNYAHLLASDVCEEIEAKIEAAEATGDPFTARIAIDVIRDRGEEARKAAWSPVFESFNALQDEDGSIPYATAHKAVAKVRQGLEAVR